MLGFFAVRALLLGCVQTECPRLPCPSGTIWPFFKGLPKSYLAHEAEEGLRVVGAV